MTTAVFRTAVSSLAIAGLTLLAAPGAIGAQLSPTQSYPSSTSATVSDATPDPGQTIAISGTATPGATVSVTLTQDTGRNLAVGGGAAAGSGGTTLGTTTADAAGAFSLNVTIPSDLAVGNYVLAVMEGSTVLSSSAFEVAGATAQGGSTANQTPTQTGDDAAATTLPVTGNNASHLGWASAAMILGGGAALVFAKRRTDPESV